MKTIKTSWKQIRRTPYQALTAIFIMTLTFFSISVFSFLVFGSSIIIKHFESTPQVTAFFKDETKPENINQLEESLKQTGKISKMRYISKQDALKIYKEQNKDDPLLTDLVTSDILPSSLDVSTTNIQDLETVATALKSSPYVEKVQYYKDIVAKLSTWTNTIRTGGGILIIFLVLESIFIMMMVIGYKVSQKRDEIEIMRLLSATNWYIRTPFMLEGITYASIGALIGWSLASIGLISATPSLQLVLKGIPVLPASTAFFFGLLLAEILIAIGLGVIASFLAVLRYLK